MSNINATHWHIAGPRQLGHGVDSSHQHTEGMVHFYCYKIHNELTGHECSLCTSNVHFTLKPPPQTSDTVDMFRTKESCAKHLLGPDASCKHYMAQSKGRTSPSHCIWSLTSNFSDVCLLGLGERGLSWEGGSSIAWMLLISDSALILGATHTWPVRLICYTLLTHELYVICTPDHCTLCITPS